MQTKAILIIVAGALFWGALTGFLYAVIKLRPREDSDLDVYDSEFEDRHPGLARYYAWRKAALTAIVISMLLLFLAIAL